MQKIINFLLLATAAVLLVTIVVHDTLQNKTIELNERAPRKTFWKSFWTPLTLKQGSLENSNRIERDLSEDAKNPLRRFFGLQHFPGTSLNSDDRMMQLHQVKHRNPYKSFFGLQPFPGTSLVDPNGGRMMQLHEVWGHDAFKSRTFPLTQRKRRRDALEMHKVHPRETMMYEVV